MNRSALQKRAGFVLATTVFLTAICALTLLAVFSYVAFTTRMTQIHLGNTQCRLAAQSAIEVIKKDVYKNFYSYTGGGAIKIGLLSGTAFQWFETYSARSPSYLGSGSQRVYANPTNICGCTVVPQFYRTLHPSGASWAIVTLRATATCRNPGGTTSQSTIEERVRFALMRSKVFDYAYFVNNYGWFQGSSITANGDVRANGNLFLDAGCVVNGRAYGSKNDELNVIGSIQNTGTFYTQDNYWSKAGNRARPTSPAYRGGDFFGGGYEVPANASERLYPYQDELIMPYISALDAYITYAQQQGGTLSGGLRYSITVNRNSNTPVITSANNGTINAHYNGAGPSGNVNLADKGALVLEGTQTNPIRINGPVVIDSDVVIKDYVTGQGTIYSGRNIHIVGNIQYLHPPNWNHPDQNPDATTAVNNTKDILGLAAKGNIVMGDYTSSSWLGDARSGLQYYMKSGPYVQQYICDESDKNIGYPRTTQYGWTSNESKFCGDYTQKDGGNTLAVTSTRSGNSTVYSLSNAKTRTYYQSVCHPNLITKLSQNSSTITQIDAVMYNNHGIFGRLGACTINGSLVCRNEAMIYTTSLKINWDHRLYSGNADSALSRMGLPMDASQPPTLLTWREVPATTTTSTTSRQ